MNHQVIRFVRGGNIVTLKDVPPTRTLLEVLRDDLHCTGTKEGCAEGDCGACSVVVGQFHPGEHQNEHPHEAGDKVTYHTVNSCIKMVHSLDGMALWTVEDLAAPDGTLHPAQKAMVQCHGSQCGFCTPGFVMSLFGMYQNHVQNGTPITRELAQQDLSGNLCRCTGYRPILDAAKNMEKLPKSLIDESTLLQNLKQLNLENKKPKASLSSTTSYLSPRTLNELLTLRAAHPEAQLVAGCTDVGLWVTKMHMQFSQVLDTTKVLELTKIEQHADHMAIGAAVTLTDAFKTLIAEYPQLHTFSQRFAGLPVRNAGTLGGNVANGSPIGDSMPLLIALRAHVVLMRTENGVNHSRELPLEALYTGYRKNVMTQDEVLAWIKVPKPISNENLKVYKISKRFDDDISAICLAINLRVVNGYVMNASIGVGGVAATPVRAIKTEAILANKIWHESTIQQTMQTLKNEFSPISDMRASAMYRTQVLGNLLQRYWLESQGLSDINLENFSTTHGVLEGAV